MLQQKYFVNFMLRRKTGHFGSECVTVSLRKSHYKESLDQCLYFWGIMQVEHDIDPQFDLLQQH